MRIALSRDCKSFDSPVIIKTPKDFDLGLSELEQTILRLADGKKITAVLCGIAGIFDNKKTKLLRAPNLPDWVGKPINKELERRVLAPVFLENDAALAGLGESVFGVGKNHKIVAYITVGTGVGGARIVDGKIDYNSFGFEPGHQIINFTDLSTKNYSLGYIDGLISGNALYHKYGKEAFEINDTLVWKKSAEYLAYGLNNTIVYWSPDIIILGGSIINDINGISIKETIIHLKKLMKTFPDIPKLEKAKLGDLGGLYGALVLLQQKYKIING
jgi:predicted NBD/HSP70 family sugar kinase